MSLHPEAYLSILNVLGVAAVIIGLLLLGRPRRTNPFPVVNRTMPFDILSLHSKWQFWTNARGLIRNGLKEADALCMITSLGEKVVLAPKYASELRSHPSLSLRAVIFEEMQSGIRGFEPFASQATWDVVMDAIRTRLTKNLGTIAKPLSEETAQALEANWTNDTEWHTLPLGPTVVNIVARMSARALLGEHLAHNEAWVRLSINYTRDSFIAATILQHVPRVLRPPLAALLPACRKLRHQLANAGKIIRPLAQEQRSQTTGKGRRPSDSLTWMDEVAKGRAYNPVHGQLILAWAAVHTSSDSLSQVLLDLSGREELIQALRDEIAAALARNNNTWDSALLADLVLMDSVLKESQRLKPLLVGDNALRLQRGNVGRQHVSRATHVRRVPIRAPAPATPEREPEREPGCECDFDVGAVCLSIARTHGLRIRKPGVPRAVLRGRRAQGCSVPHLAQVRSCSGSVAGGHGQAG
ncbi:cytochrome P450 [Aspergillus mulundensis]|uniref:Cytochrome P450 n=1 Tax=Aspergillus mulundensis TaxID=1810919 RepID=A0A3D8T308_9EURO|nr:hypothetical protein DSM5745_00231 [Aspergillus mulundensis]RDW92909.1 hypothetical protein DSM5745_00231 [Aspergillus mulundensis]